LESGQDFRAGRGVDSWGDYGGDLCKRKVQSDQGSKFFS
jgi:hypothetical protein